MIKHTDDSGQEPGLHAVPSQGPPTSAHTGGTTHVPRQQSLLRSVPLLHESRLGKLLLVDGRDCSLAAIAVFEEADAGDKVETSWFQARAAAAAATGLYSCHSTCTPFMSTARRSSKRPDIMKSREEEDFGGYWRYPWENPFMLYRQVAATVTVSVLGYDHSNHHLVSRMVLCCCC
nr:hypothetical protein CFP56_73816 [Quercus suber]